MDNIDDLADDISRYLDRFAKATDAIQKDILTRLEIFIKDLEVKDGKIVASVNNLRKINKIKPILERAILSPTYKKNVKQFSEAFYKIADKQNSYFATLVETYKAPAVLEEIKQLAVSETVRSLTESGMQSAVIDKAKNILKTNITTGSNYTGLLKQMKSFLTTDKKSEGALVRYAKQITTDALNQFSANHTKIVTDDLGLEWFGYTGSIVDGSRDFCRHLVKKRFFNKKEIPDLLKGKIGDEKIPVNPKTGLPFGMNENTDVNNFQVLRGGYQCNHSIIPVSKFRIPKDLRAKFEKA